MNKREMLSVFKRVVRGLLLQGEPSMDRQEEECKYNGTKGKHCAMGILINQKFYRRSLEGNTIKDCGKGGDRIRKVLIKSGVNIQNDNDINFLGELQTTHDCVLSSPWIKNFTYIAQKYLGMNREEATALVDSLRPKTGKYAKKK